MRSSYPFGDLQVNIPMPVTLLSLVSLTNLVYKTITCLNAKAYYLHQQTCRKKNDNETSCLGFFKAL